MSLIRIVRIGFIAMGKEQPLDSIMLKMQGIINNAQEELRDYHVHILKKYFSEDGAPLRETIVLSTGERLEVPRISLVPQNLLAIDEVVLAFSVPAAPEEVKAFAEAVELRPSPEPDHKPSFMRALLLYKAGQNNNADTGISRDETKPSFMRVLLLYIERNKRGTDKARSFMNALLLHTNKKKDTPDMITVSVVFKSRSWADISKQGV